MIERNVPCFHTPMRVQFDEVDMYGIVHHARYIVYMERARLDMFIRLGHAPRQDPTMANGMVVGALEIKYRKPSFISDDLIVETWCERVKGPVVVLHNRIRCGDETRATGTVKLVYTGSDGKPARVPALLKERLHSAALDCADATLVLG